MSLYQKKLGESGEELACNYLKKNSFCILEKNFRSKFGEVDIIAEKNHCLYFVEVKTRSGDQYGEPYESVNQNKVYHIKKAAEYYLLQKEITDYKLKIAVFSILIDGDKQKIDFWEDIDG